MSSKITTGIAATLLGVSFLLSLGRIAIRRSEQASSGTVTIRFAHYQLEAGLESAFEAIASEYEEMHPGVRVLQLRIPERVYPNWAVTQLVGGTAPDLVQIGKGAEGERIGRFFVPLSSWVSQPNPYNKGTELDGVAWRDTFVDGLVGPPAYHETLLDYYGIPNSMHTVRVFYNKALLREITGSDAIPESFQQFMAVCEQISEYGRRNGLNLVPIAGSKYSSPYLIDNLLTSQTQRLVEQQAIPTLSANTDELWLRMLEEEVTLDSTEIRLALSILRDVGRHMPPGFLQLEREDSVFYFVQRRAVMIITGSWDSNSIIAEVPFEVGVFKVPTPAETHPKYGANVLGPPSEAGTRTAAALGLYSGSEHPEVAIDFLQFMTSRRGGQIFTDRSGWLSSVVGVEPSEAARQFQPRLEGAVRGVRLNSGSETDRIFATYFHRLMSAGGSVEKFVEAIEPHLKSAMISDLARAHRERRANVGRFDTAIAAYAELSAMDSTKFPEDKLDALVEVQNAQEIYNAFIEAGVGEAGYKLQL